MLGGRRKTSADGSSRTRGAIKQDAIRDAVAQSEIVESNGNALVDILCSDDSLSAAAVQRIRNLSERALSPADLAGLLAFRIEKLRKFVEDGDLTAERELASWEKLGSFATSVVQLQSSSSAVGGASITIEWGGQVASSSTAGNNGKRRDDKIGDIIDTE